MTVEGIKRTNSTYWFDYVTHRNYHASTTYPWMRCVIDNQMIINPQVSTHNVWVSYCLPLRISQNNPLGGSMPT
jgi:hypothetical protein